MQPVNDMVVGGTFGEGWEGAGAVHDDDDDDDDRVPLSPQEKKRNHVRGMPRENATKQD